MSVRPKNKIASYPPGKSSNPSCHEWISVAAYYKAEATKFEPGQKLDNWLEAEVDYIKLQITSFFNRCEEDGGISLAELQGLGRYVCLDHPERINTEKELIHKIQIISKHRPCFQTRLKEDCGEVECEWREECQKLIAAWLR
ncbi:MAG: DUF2934 domain-containing protein [Methylococcales bacterium]|nr:DUF2934 domain-containing protein [Methylococcales bacterium]